jgi:hypothetical protein
VNTKTLEIPALEVTDEKTHDGNKLCDLVDKTLKQNNNACIKTVLADGVPTITMRIKYLKEKRILPGIKVSKDSIASPKNNKTRNRGVKLQTIDDILKWEKKRRYGKR